MSDDNVLDLHDLSSHKARTIINDIITNHSERVIFTRIHSRERMDEKNISDTQVYSCLKNGRFKDEPYWDHECKDWKMSLETIAAGDHIGIAIALDHDKKGNKILIVTAYKWR